MKSGEEKMFEKARIRLTAWYLVIIMLICGLFSIIIYSMVSRQIERIAHPRFFEPPIIAQEIVEEQKARLISSLILINGVILIFSGGAGYLLAGRTLKPIKEMVDEQNQFVSDASHELRTPLATLRAEMEGKLLEKNISDLAARNLINSNLEELDRLQRLSESLLKLTRVHKATEKVLVTDIINDSINKMSQLATKKQIRIENNRLTNKILLEKDSLQELLIILLDNAIKYSPEKSKVVLSAKKVRQELIISVKDQGTGISSEDMPHIFERFYRADKSRSDTSGYGLGLSIAKKIVEAHKGTIMAESKLGKGSTFTISIPA